MRVAYINLEDYDGSSDKTEQMMHLVNQYDVVFFSEILLDGSKVLNEWIVKHQWHALKCAYEFTHQIYAISKAHIIHPFANAIDIEADSWSAGTTVMDRFLGIRVKGCVLIGVHFKSSKGTRTPTFVNEQRQRAMSTFKISKLIHMTSSPCVVFGDFNSRHNENGVLELFKGTSGLFPVSFKHHSNDIDHVFRNEYASIRYAELTAKDYSDHPLISFVMDVPKPVVRQFVRKSKGRTLADLLNAKNG